MKKTPEILSTTLLDAEEVASQVFQIEQMHLRFSNGEERQYRRIAGTGRGAVMIVPMVDNDTVLLIREYSAGTQRYEIQLPKGGIDEGETVLEAANRELKEEVGKGANQLTYLTQLGIAPGFMAHQTDVVLAQGLYDERLQGDEPEELEVIPWSLHNLTELVMREDCTEARSVAALYLVKEKLHG